PDLVKLYQSVGRDKLEILAVAVNDNPEMVKQIVKKFDIEFPILFDSLGKISSKFSVNGFPESFIVLPDGNLALVLDDKKSEPVYKIIGPRNWGESFYINQILEFNKK
ncbi:MAG: TlpA family protein disulfide reductase, partial [Bdellovibrionales bacterium]|nr:TlpA family protein disulfide reductase [Bdellovibrionales bacterium]